MIKNQGMMRLALAFAKNSARLLELNNNDALPINKD